MLDALRKGDNPIASHLLWPGILDDANPAERALGIEAGLAWGKVAEATVVYDDLGVSPGMAQGIARAVAEGRPVEYRRLPARLNEKGPPIVAALPPNPASGRAMPPGSGSARPCSSLSSA
jgi:hypothetical protein